MIRTVFSATLAATALAAIALGASSLGAAAHAQGVTQADIGAFVRDQDGAPIGSLRAVRGDQAVVWVGFYNTPGNHLVTLPLGDITPRDGRLVLNAAAAPRVAAR